MTSSWEYRPGLTFEVRATDTGKTLVGHAAVFNERAEIFEGELFEEFAPGAFAEAIRDPSQDVRALIEHTPLQLLARQSANTLRLREDSRGLAVEIDLPDTQLGRDTATMVARGDLTQMSIGFRGIDEELSRMDGALLRVVTRADLRDVSLTAFPVFEGTDIALRAKATFEEAERLGQRRLHIARIRLAAWPRKP